MVKHHPPGPLEGGGVGRSRARGAVGVDDDAGHAVALALGDDDATFGVEGHLGRPDERLGPSYGAYGRLAEVDAPDDAGARGAHVGAPRVAGEEQALHAAEVGGHHLEGARGGALLGRDPGAVGGALRAAALDAETVGAAVYAAASAVSTIGLEVGADREVETAVRPARRNLAGRVAGRAGEVARPVDADVGRAASLFAAAAVLAVHPRLDAGAAADALRRRALRAGVCGSGVRGARVHRSCVGCAHIGRARVHRSRVCGAGVRRACVHRSRVCGSGVRRACVHRSRVCGARVDCAGVQRAGVGGPCVRGRTRVGRSDVRRACVDGAEIDRGRIGLRRVDKFRRVGAGRAVVGDRARVGVARVEVGGGAGGAAARDEQGREGEAARKGSAHAARICHRGGGVQPRATSCRTRPAASSRWSEAACCSCPRRSCRSSRRGKTSPRDTPW